MTRYPDSLIEMVRSLRKQGKTYGEIRAIVDRQIPKSTLSEWCQKVELPKSYIKRIERLNFENLNKGRLIALEINRIKREEFFKRISKDNTRLAGKIGNKSVAKIALAILCLGEASKYHTKRRAFTLGSSDHRIIILFIELLKLCYDFDIEKIRCTVQCRADQNTFELEKYWQQVTNIPKRLFYKPLIDSRTKGKPTRRKDYKGVLRIDYFNTKAQLDLENLADLLYIEVNKRARSLKG